MALTDYLTVGGVEVANHARLNTYLQTVGSPLDSTSICSCETLTAEVLGELPYTTPEEDEAPWYDADVPESAEFAGLLVLSVEGLDENPVKRSVTNSVAGGGSIGPARVVPRTITVTGVLLGATCCGVEYGFHWLTEALQGCTGGQCDGDCVTLYNCCPGADMDEATFNAKHRRTMRRVALVDGPRVISRAGDGCTSGECQTGADLLTVEFTLVAGTPWLWTDPMQVMQVVPPVDLDGGCVTWCLHPPGGAGCDGPCRFAPCVDATAHCADPRCQPSAPPVPVAPDTCFCLPLAVETSYYDVDLTSRPSWSVDAPVITLSAGSTDLRNITIEFFERSPNDTGLTCEEVAAQYRCSPHSTYHVAFVPAGGAVTLDGQVGRAFVECGGTCEASPDVYGRDGQPPSWANLGCATYCLAISSDVANPPSPEALITVNVSGRNY
ncbi:hypothetical protein [Streptomyces sp. NPDC058891]|uniref:hypothetical protein n=1 Tax=Streptomyces sp. NPDC058891 TaxID=3346667 RepID=UPI0036C992E5